MFRVFLLVLQNFVWKRWVSQSVQWTCYSCQLNATSIYCLVHMYNWLANYHPFLGYCEMVQDHHYYHHGYLDQQFPGIWTWFVKWVCMYVLQQESWQKESINWTSNSSNTGRYTLPNMYAQWCAEPKGECIHIRQCTPVCVTTNMLHSKSH